ncbi:unnamed protein product [Paramecium octaurelia]|uniref:Phosphatidylinositol-4-phosphate 5-kinase n=1 Tax=Paramecium octaurelia TaxID=43137 RepID=A0A8S1SW69_PAROT|nr:unnamed protein product [Paramecium octaurelia]
MKQFTQKELDTIQKRFSAMSNNGSVNYKQFQNTMGILGLDHATFLLDRIFNVISEGKKVFTLNQYINYLQLVMFGNEQQKAQLSFAFIDLQRKGYIEYKEFQQMLLDLTMFWNQITGSRVTPRQSYIGNLWDQFECERLDFPQFYQKYQIIQESIDWYEYFNETEILLQSCPQANKAFILQNMIDQLQNEIRNCVNLLSDYERNKKQIIDESFVYGPCNFSTSQIAKNGDDDPSFEISFLSNIQTNSFSLTNSSDHPLDQVLNRLEYLQQMIEQAINLPQVVQPYYFKSPARLSTQRKKNTIMNMPKRKAKQKLSVYFGHENWNLILNLMIGMKQALSNIQPEFYGKNALQHEFAERYVYDILQNRSSNFDFRKAYQFKDYAPSIFLRIRRQFQISNKDFQRSVGPENLIGNLVFGKLDSLTELGSTGRSGSFFYYTQDCQYMIKTISENEARLLRKILPRYFKYVQTHPYTLLSRIFGLHQLKIFKSKTEFTKIYLVTIVNIFRSGLDIDVRYDIKGSLYGRQTSTNPNEMVQDNTIALKDLDLLQKKDCLNLEPQDQQLLLKTIIEDCSFLKDNDIIDYSLLVGFHKRDINRSSLYGQQVQNNSHPFESFEGGILSMDKQWIYFVGIIDILTLFNTKKYLEYGFKSTLVSNDISCVPPARYAERFANFIATNLILQKSK